MDIRPIRSTDDYEWALREVAGYFDTPPQPGSEDANRFDILSDLIEAYEQKNHAIEPLDPVDLIRTHLEATGKGQSDLAALLGSRSRASEVLNRRRALTLEMIQKLATAWGLPADGLVRPYHLNRT